MSRCRECQADLSGIGVFHADDCSVAAEHTIVVIDRLQGEILALTVERDNLKKMLEDAHAKFEEAREIIAQVSYSPEFKKWNYQGREQDPCGVHTFTAKYADKPVPMCKLEVKEGFFDARALSGNSLGLRPDIRFGMEASDTADGPLVDSNSTPGKVDPLKDLFPAEGEGSPT